MKNLLLGTVLCLTAFYSPAATSDAALIFPGRQEKTIILQASGTSNNMLEGEAFAADSPLIKKIVKELDFPFHRSL